MSNVKVTNLQPQPISLSKGVQLAAAGTKGSTREVEPSERVRKLAERKLISIQPAGESAGEPGAEAAVTFPASTATADEKRRNK